MTHELVEGDEDKSPVTAPKLRNRRLGKDTTAALHRAKI